MWTTLAMQLLGPVAGRKVASSKPFKNTASVVNQMITNKKRQPQIDVIKESFRNPNSLQNQALRQKATAQQQRTAPSAGSGGVGGTGGGGGYSSSTSAAKAEKTKIMTAQELAELYGINYDYDYILDVLNKGTDAQYAQMRGDVERLQGTQLRQQNAVYDEYLNAMRESRANAINTGMGMGASAANELSAILGAQQNVSLEQNEANLKLLQLIDEAATARGKNEGQALSNMQELGKYFGTLSQGMDANAVQREAAELAARAQVDAAGIQAGGAIGAARINAASNPTLDTYRWLNENINTPFGRMLYDQGLSQTRLNMYQGGR